MNRMEWSTHHPAEVNSHPPSALKRDEVGLESHSAALHRPGDSMRKLHIRKREVKKTGILVIFTAPIIYMGIFIGPKQIWQ